jgi:hypothetical protein
VRAENEAARRDGSAQTFGDVFRAEPGRVLMILLAIVCLLGLVAVRVWLVGM